MKIEIDKPVIPQFVADWIEEHKEDCDDLVWENNSIYNIVNNLRHDIKMGFVNKRIGEWLYSDIKNEIAFEKAIILGCEVEQYPLYYAKIKGYDLLEYDMYWYVYSYQDTSILDIASYGEVLDNIYIMSKDEWSELGVNNTNADFEKVEE